VAHKPIRLDHASYNQQLTTHETVKDLLAEHQEVGRLKVNSARRESRAPWAARMPGEQAIYFVSCVITSNQASATKISCLSRPSANPATIRVCSCLR